MIPKLSHPIYTIVQPTTKKSLKFRPYLVKEEKLLLLAKQTKQVEDAYQSIKTILNSCCTDSSFDAETIPLIDVEYLFLKLRSFSVNNIEKLQIKDQDDEKIYDLVVNFDDIKTIFPEEERKMKIILDGERGKKVSISLKYPDISIYNNDNNGIMDKLSKGDYFDFIKPIIDKVFVGESIYEMNDDELREFLDNLDHKTFRELEYFIAYLPHLELSVSYVNSLGNEKTIYFRSLMDFFFFV